MYKLGVKKALKIIKKVIVSILIIIVVYAVIGNLAALNNTLYNVVHFRNYVVLTGSMEPSISPGDYVTILKVNKDKLKEGDVITYTRENAAVTHKIVSIDGDTVITQGTANNIADDPITKEDIIGKCVFKIPKVGYIMKFMSSLSGLILIFGFTGIAIFWELTDPEREKNKEKVLAKENAQLENSIRENTKEYTKEDALRDIIFDNLKEFGRLSKEDEDVILNEKSIDTLKNWCKVSGTVDSIESFFDKISGVLEK